MQPGVSVPRHVDMSSEHYSDLWRHEAKDTASCDLTAAATTSVLARNRLW